MNLTLGYVGIGKFVRFEYNKNHMKVMLIKERLS